MTFKVEDGSGYSDSNSFCSVAAADAYWALRGATAAWGSASDTVKQQGLVVATDYLSNEVRYSYVGIRKSLSQALLWPRIGAVTRDGLAILSTAIPQALINACAYLASRVVGGATIEPDEPNIPVKRQKVDVIETEYAVDSFQYNTRVIAAVNGMLAHILSPADPYMTVTPYYVPSDVDTTRYPEIDIGAGRNPRISDLGTEEIS